MMTQQLGHQGGGSRRWVGHKWGSPQMSVQLGPCFNYNRTLLANLPLTSRSGWSLWILTAGLALYRAQVTPSVRFRCRARVSRTTAEALALRAADSTAQATRGLAARGEFHLTFVRV